MERSEHITLREAPPTEAFGWFDGRAHDVVLPLAATHRPERGPTMRASQPARTVVREHGHLPGASDWLYAKLYGHPDRQTSILTNHLPALLAAWNTPPQWWFLRYRDPEPHLRLRIRLGSTEEFNDTAQRVGAWANELQRRGLLSRLQLDTYHPETGRFGEGHAMAAAESAFAADSAAAIAQLAHIAPGGTVHQHALIAASLVDLATSFTASISAGMTWLVDHLHTASIPAPNREIRDQAVHLANPNGRWAKVRAIPGGDAIVTAWERRQHALTAYRTTLAASDGHDPEGVLGDLLHLHHVRVAGIDPDAERACGHLARAAALSWLSRPQGAS